MNCPTCGRPGALPGALVCPACLAEISMNCKPKDTRMINSVERQMESLLAERNEALRERDEWKRAAGASIEGNVVQEETIQILQMVLAQLLLWVDETPDDYSPEACVKRSIIREARSVVKKIGDKR